MTIYQRNPETLRKYDDLSGAPIYRAKYRCSRCCNPIEEQFAGPQGTCYHCGRGDLDISPIDKIEAVCLYLKKDEWHDEQGPIIDGFVEFGNEFLDAKELNYTEKMTEIISFGIRTATYENFDLIVVPPSSSNGPNHMVPKAERIEDIHGIIFEDAIVDVEGGMEMKKVSSASKRRELARGRYECMTNVQDERVLILDDLVTSCATSIGVAEAVNKRGASQIGVVSMARSVDLYTLKNRNLIKPE